MSMKWYEGNIAEAVQLCKQRNAIFVVYVEGQDDKSMELNTNINDVEISQILSSEQFVAIKIISDSEAYVHFQQIYKVVPVPSLFFIGKSGAPLKILANTTNLSDLKVAVTESLEKAGLTMSNVSQTPQTSEASNSGPSTSSTNEVQRPAIPTDTEVSKPQLTPEEQIERAKKLVEQARILKEQKKIEDDRLAEIERRKMGRDVQELQKWQQDQALQQLKADRQREKHEEMQARQRILDQIAQDRAERAHRFPQTQAKPSTSLGESSPSHPTPPSSFDTARIQFRLPDGSAHTNSFKSTDNFLVVRQYVSQILVGTGIRDYSLATMFPRREFSEEDNSTNLIDLNLVPTSVLLILPITSHAAAVIRTHTPGFVGSINNFLWSLILPFVGMFGYVRDLVFGRRGNQTGTASKREHPQSSNDISPPKRKSNRGDTNNVRRQGSTNVHRLSNNDSDDENNTWNGNSTQQM